MRVSITITDYSWPELPGHLGRIAAAADRSGVDTLWVADHLLQADPHHGSSDPMLEAYTTLGFLAARTERLEDELAAERAETRQLRARQDVVLRTATGALGGKAEVARQYAATFSCPTNVAAIRMSIAVTFWAMNHPAQGPTQVSAMSRDIHVSAMSRNRTPRSPRVNVHKSQSADHL